MPAVEPSKKENVAVGSSSKGVEGERGTTCASPLHAAVPVVPAAGAVAAAGGGMAEAGKEKTMGGRLGARKALFADAAAGLRSDEQVTGLDARADAREHARKEVGSGEEAAEAGCTATWTGQAEEGQGKNHGDGNGRERCGAGDAEGELVAVGSCMDVLERVRERSASVRDEDAGSTSDDDILNSLPQDLVHSVRRICHAGTATCESAVTASGHPPVS